MARANRLGYGWAHQKQRKHLVAHFKEGDPCRRCGRPMWSWQRLDAGHHPNAPVTSGSLPDALEHAHCNRRAGAIVTNTRRRAASQPASRRW